METLVRLILLLGTVGLLLVTGGAVFARHWWLFDLFSHFRLQYVVGALVLLVVALSLRVWPAALALLLVAVVHGAALRPLWLGGDEAVAAAGEPLRVVSVNVLAKNPTPPSVFRFASGTEADMVVLVDAQGDSWRETLTAFGGLFPHRAPDGWEDGAPVILFSKHPIARDELVQPVDGRRPYLLAEVNIGDGIPTLVAAVHPASPKPDEPEDSHIRNAQIDHVAESLDGVDGPVIVAGDLNTTPFSPHFQDLVAAADLRHAATGEGYVGTWPVRWLPLRIPIDHLLVKGPLAVSSLQRGPEVGSDHFPIVADLRLLDETTAEP